MLSEDSMRTKMSCVMKKQLFDEKKKKNATVKSVTDETFLYYWKQKLFVFYSPLKRMVKQRGTELCVMSSATLLQTYYDKLRLHQTACYSLRVPVKL